MRRNRPRWFGQVLRENPDDWVRRCMDYEAVGKRPKGRLEMNWRDLVAKDHYGEMPSILRRDAILRGDAISIGQ